MSLIKSYPGLISNNKTELHPVRWDAHGCPPFKIDADLSFLHRYKNSGVNLISLNVGFDLTNPAETIGIINYITQWILNTNHEFTVIKNTKDIEECLLQNKLGISFDIEGSNPLDGQLKMVEQFYSLGVRQLAFTYNTNNHAGSGCLDIDTGLTQFGKDLVNKCNEVGMVIDCSHAGYKTSMEIMEQSKYPIIFSHSNPAGLHQHPRNIKDDQISFCAETNGVVGINGIGIFLGDNDIRTERIVEHIDYVIQKVGAEHVGIGLDCIFSADEVKEYVANNPDTFPIKHGFDDVKVAQPEQFSEISGLLKKRGYSNTDINNILGENFLRVAKSVWK